MLKPRNLSSKFKFCYKIKQCFSQYRTLFFGSDIISKEILLPLHQNSYSSEENPEKIIKSLEIVTHQKSANRGNYPIHEYCDKNKLFYHEPLKGKIKEQHSLQWNEFLENKLKKNPFDIGIVCSFGYMIPNNIIDSFNKGIIIIHPSLLPKYRGAAPIYHTLLNGDQISGVSFIEISKNQFDAGAILLQKSLNISTEWNYQDLAIALGKLAGLEVISLIKNLDEFRKNSIKQNENEKSGAKKIQANETFISWYRDSEASIIRKYRAFSGSNLHALKTVFDKKIIFIEEIEKISNEEIALLSEYKQTAPGRIYLIKQKKYQKFLYVSCIENGWIKIKKWKFPTQPIRDSHKFISQFIDKESVYKSLHEHSPYNFSNNE